MVTTDEDHIRAAREARQGLTQPSWDTLAADVAERADKATEEALAALAAAASAGDQRGDGPLQEWAEDWESFWATDHNAEHFFAAPILGLGRGHVLYAPSKTGKSLLALELAVAVATGKPFLDMPAQPPRKVLYLDYEMVAADLAERLKAFGYSSQDDLSCLRYVRMPGIQPLDTYAGGQAVLSDAVMWGAELVIVDTTARAVLGEENKSETTRDLYRHTLMLLKQIGVTTLRVDHAGKQEGAGMRGSSAKTDDVDVVWRLTPSEDGEDRFLLEATHRRVGWIPERVELLRSNHEPPMHRRWDTSFIQPATTFQEDLIRHMDAAGLPTAGISATEARTTYVLEFDPGLQ
jgi:hypothetical protein